MLKQVMRVVGYLILVIIALLILSTAAQANELKTYYASRNNL